MSDSNSTNGVVESNGTTEAPTNRIRGKGRGKGKPKESRFAKLWDLCRELPGKDKGKIRGHVNTGEGEVGVTLNAFPEALDDDGYAEAAGKAGINVKFDLDGTKAAGVHLDSGSRKLKGEAAKEFLAGVSETDSDEFNDADDE